MLRLLPQPTRIEPKIVTNNREEVNRNVKTVAKLENIPPYGKRKGWIPRKLEDFGDGGAYPEIHVAQYPLNMGREKKATQNNTLALKMDSSGKIRYDEIVRQGTGDKIIYSTAQDLVPLKELQDKMPERPDEEVVQETTEKTKKALERILDGKVRASGVKTVEGGERGESQFIRYTPSNQSSSKPPQTKIIRMVEKAVDPLEPPKFKHKRVPNGPPSPPVPIMHSPPRKISKQERDEWNIPPSISNWKNPGGYTIPLDKRLASDGRGLQDNQINDKFSKLAEALYVTERNAREEVRRRAELRKEMQLEKKKRKEETIRELARETRKEKGRGGELQNTVEDDEEEDERERGSWRGEEEGRERPRERDERGGRDEEGDEEVDERALRERERIRREILREKDRERRLKKAGKLGLEKERDISEKIALGDNVPLSEEAMYDQRLFNQTGGLESGFLTDDTYDTYDKPLFEGTSASVLYKPKPVNLGDEEDDNRPTRGFESGKFRPNRGFSGANEQEEPSSGGGSYRSGPVQFEREVKEEDSFGIEKFLTETKNSSLKKGFDNIGKRGSMQASGSGNRDAFEQESSSSKRQRDIQFESSSSSRDNKRYRDKK